jgi:hypothetical protein
MVGELEVGSQKWGAGEFLLTDGSRANANAKAKVS